MHVPHQPERGHHLLRKPFLLGSFLSTDTWFGLRKGRDGRQLGVLLPGDQDLLGRQQHDRPSAWALILGFMWPGSASGNGGQRPNL